ncbi:ABC transporter permease [Pseudomarimonas arenosa]|uniref:ABC transporter permease n=1 Tax=Pseudomarimonas arenosa TaxID=2774145 RepID=A0AAW3ZUS9_9GAMM|nr:ABC transporter permease [Pseudomarimonas arenosa]MBD8528067.1 ABC transporter permease [Pseudomarimonas arenosa]
MSSSTLRYALRRIGNAPSFSLNIVIMLTLGVALSVCMFATLQGVFGSLPFPNSDQVVVVEVSHPERGVEGGSLTPAEAMRLSQADTPFAKFGFYAWGGMTVYQDERPREFNMVNVGPGFFAALGMQPLHGRWFSEDEFEQPSATVILSQSEWMRLFGGDPTAIGKRLRTSAGDLELIGVMPEAFAIPSPTVGAWRAMPRNAYPTDQPWVWNARFVNGLARLDPTQSNDVLQSRLDAVSDELAERYQLGQPAARIAVQPMLERIVGGLRPVLWSAFALAVLVLLIACANVAILVDARQVARRHEQAVMQALGASRGQLYRSLLLEIFLLSAFAVAAGCLIASAGIDGLRELARDSLPRVDAIAIDGWVLLFAAALGLLVPMATALAGALKPRADAADAIRAGGRGMIGASRRRAWLPALGAALSTTSLVAASALLLSLWQLKNVDPGLRHQQIYALQLFHGGAPDKQRDFARRLRERLAELPGVDQVAVTSAAPLSQIGSFEVDVKLPERDQPEGFRLGLRRVSPNYGDLLDIGLVAGRGIEAGDRDGADKVAVINQELARRLFGEAAALNRLLELPLGQGERVRYRVVGVVEDSLNNGLRSAVGPELWVPFEDTPSVGVTFLVASRLPLANYEKQFSDALFEVDPQEASTRMFALSDDFEAQLASARFFARTVGAFALAALLLAAFGVYAVAALRQQQRSSEFGLRLAIGARPMKLLVQMLRESLRSVVLGMAVGVLLALGVLRLLQGQLFGLEQARFEVMIYGLTSLIVAAVLAALLPAWRAAHTDPMDALRHE